MPGLLTSWRRSLIGQMSVLVLIFMILAFVYFVVWPVVESRQRADPMQKSEAAAHRELLAALTGSRGLTIENVHESPVLAEIAAKNSEFRYFVQLGSRSAEFGGPPQWRDKVDFSSVVPTDAADEGTAAGFSFGGWRAVFHENGVETKAMILDVDGERGYIEYGGIVNPRDVDQQLLFLDDLRRFWLTGKDLLISALGFTLIAVLVLLLASRSLRRVASVANQLDDGAPAREFPEDGLPTEVLPFVRAVNDMIGRVRAAQDEQAFFLSAAAHELRTPLTVVRTWLDDLPDSETKQRLRQEMRNISSLVEQLLRLMSIRNRDFTASDVDLVAVAQSVVADKAPMAIEQGVALALDNAANSMTVQGDETLLKVALGNLIENAISFSKPGDTVQVRVDPVKGIDVCDQGPGIPAEELASIFEPFAKNPPNRKGHGLGLAIVGAIMSLHRGAVSASNNTGGGATFELSFPRP